MTESSVIDRDAGRATEGHAAALGPASQSKGDAVRLAAGASVTLVGTVSGRIVNVLTHVLLARMLGPAEYGLYALGWTFLRIIALVGPLGLDRAVVVFVGRAGEQTSRRNGALLVCLSGAAALGAALGAGALLAPTWAVRAVFHDPGTAGVIRALAPAFALAALLRVAAEAARARHSMAIGTLIDDVLQPWGNLLFGVGLVAAGFGLRGALLGLVAMSVVAVTIAGLWIWALYPSLVDRAATRARQGREIWSFSLTTAVSTLAVTLVIWADRLIVGHYLDAKSLGVYQAAAQLSIVFGVLLGAFNAVFGPMIVALHRGGEHDRLNELFRVSTKWGLYISLPIFLVIAVAARDIMVALYGPAYMSGATVLLLLAAAQLVNAGTGAVGFLLTMTGHQRIWMWISLAMLGFQIAASVLLVPRYGLVGAAVATALSISGVFILGLIAVRRRLSLSPYDRRYGKGLLAASLAAAAVCLVRLSGIVQWPLIVASGVVAAFVFGTGLVLLGLDAEDRQLGGAALARIPFLRERIG